jgi:hypothetical protein
LPRSRGKKVQIPPYFKKDEKKWFFLLILNKNWLDKK